MNPTRRSFLKTTAAWAAVLAVTPLLARLPQAQTALQQATQIGTKPPPIPTIPAIKPVTLSDAEWQKRLPKQAYQVLRQEDTEAPFTSPLNDEHRPGIFTCLGCALPLFSSWDKFESGTGWPSFTQPLAPQVIGTRTDTKLFIPRTEVHCARCRGHLGHVFEDGPQTLHGAKSTGLRYCMNGAALGFSPTP